jgi:uncharacterized protein YkwD
LRDLSIHVLDSFQGHLHTRWKELRHTMQQTFPIRLVWVAGMLSLALVLGACGSGQPGGASSQASRTYSPAPARLTPIPSPSSSAASDPSPTKRPAAATPTSSGSASRPTVLEQQIAQAVFQAINADRATAGLSPLVWSNSLVTGAYAHSLLMSGDNQLAHQLPGEPAIGARVSQDGVKWTWCGENIGETSDTSASGALKLHQMMMAEKPPNDGHRQNILSDNFTLLGIAVVIDSSHQLWLTEDFAN